MFILLTSPDSTKVRVNAMSISSYFTYDVFTKETELKKRTRILLNNGTSIEVVEPSNEIDHVLEHHFHLT